LNISRAAFLKALGVAGLGTCLDTGASADAAPANSTTTRRGLVSRLLTGRPAPIDADAAFFRQFLGDSFVVRSLANRRYRVVLAEVAEQRASRGVEQFSLVFHGAPGVGLGEGTHAFTHRQLGAFDLFIVPIGPANRPRTVFQACFSRHQTASRHRRL
jgi:uncharacterized protein DUF6916